MTLKIGAALFAVLLCVTLLFAVLYMECTLPGVMARRFSAFSAPDIEARVYKTFAGEITDYLKGKAESPAFLNARERAHMADVRELVLLLRTLLLCAASGALLLGVFFLRVRFYKIIRRTLLGSALAVLLVTAYGVMNFSGLFTFFHHAAFANDLWMLNPETDMLIRLMPESFFQAYALSIALIFLFLCAAVWGVLTVRRGKWVITNAAFKRRKP